MQDLVDARRTANSADIAAIDEKMDQVCQEIADDIERTSTGTALNTRIQRMKQLVLEELCERRDKARQER